MFEVGPFAYTFKGNEKKIFSNEKIVINENELVLIAGPSGAGKSTMLQILKGIIPHFSSGELSGDILYKKKRLDGDFFHQNLSEIIFLFQNPFSQIIYPFVKEEFFFSMENFKFSKDEMSSKKKELSESFGLDSFWHKKTADLSHGQCQRLVLASLLAINPKVLLLDEPTAFLDPEARADFYQWLKRIKGTQTIILVDHHLDEVLPFVDQILNVSLNGEVTKASRLSNLNQEQANKLSLPNLVNQNQDSIELNLNNLFFKYPDQEKLLEDISLGAGNGDVFVIRGKNGKGKSTLLKIIAGILKPQMGKVEVYKNKKEILAKNIFKEIGFVFQNPESHFFYDSISEELKNMADKTNAQAFLELFFKDIQLSRSPFLLSEGEKRRLSILMTVFQDKSILLYDEPTFGQDRESILIIHRMIVLLKKMGKIQIIISHDEQFIQSLGAKVYNLDNGTLLRNS